MFERVLNLNKIKLLVKIILPLIGLTLASVGVSLALYMKVELCVTPFTVTTKEQVVSEFVYVLDGTFK